ncbi:hypothetical protein GM921_00205 [Pedobacter sp. LMG 31464]|uniref:Uncharacterized protein n=1 Tax=Pedobacter planticolens TaxID=2679964 RepID=A0A923DVP0_9SPHI|nr:hypothetical protein [Pedobacter planticolens]MBB2143891.1 hypothetical protein [Pedobacter planticolens]
MENIEIINLWKQYDEKLEKSLSLNQKIITELQQQKAKNALKPARNYKILAVVVGIVYAVVVAYFLYHLNPIASIFLKISIAIHLLVTVIAIAMYVRQIILISEIDNSQNIIQMQQKLACLRASTVNVIGICFLQLPIFSTWNITFKMINETPLNFWFIQMPIVALFTFAGIWLFKNVDIKNMDKRWFKIMFYGVEWSSILKSGKFLKEIENFEKM